MKNLIILGSGRSGTSLLTGMLANSGFHLGDNSDYLNKNSANPKGYFEDYEVNTINEDILKESLITLPEKIRKLFFPTTTFYRARWLARVPITNEIVTNTSINNRIEALIKKPSFCYKDPRFSYTLPVWQEITTQNNIDVRYLVVYREPSKTANSIVTESKENKALHSLKMNTTIALKVWELMYTHILENYNHDNQKDRWLFIHFDQLFSIEKQEEIEVFTQSNIDKNFPEIALSRSKSKVFQIDSKVLDIYKCLNNLSGCQ